MATRIRTSKKIRSMAEQNLSAPLASALAGADVKRDEFADIQLIDVNDIRPDPEQHRRLEVTVDILRNPDLAPDDRIKENAVAIVGLGKSLLQVGQQELIEVYRDGSVFRLVKGERRWWAAQLVGLASLRAKVLPARPDRMRLKQFVENVQRQGLAQSEMLTAIESVVEEARAQGLPIATAEDLENITGLTRRIAARWWRLIDQRPDVGQAIRDGLITRATDIDAVLVAKPEDMHTVIASRTDSGGNSSTTTSFDATIRTAAATKVRRKPMRGRPRAFRFTVHDPRVMRVLLTRLGRGDEGMDWDDHEAIQSAFADALHDIEKQVRA